MSERRALGLLAEAVEVTLAAYRAQQQRELDDEAREAVDHIVAQAEAEAAMHAALIEAGVGWWAADAAVAKLASRMARAGVRRGRRGRAARLTCRSPLDGNCSPAKGGGAQKSAQRLVAQHAAGTRESPDDRDVASSTVVRAAVVAATPMHGGTRRAVGETMKKLLIVAAAAALTLALAGTASAHTSEECGPAPEIHYDVRFGEDMAAQERWFECLRTATYPDPDAVATPSVPAPTTAPAPAPKPAPKAKAKPNPKRHRHKRQVVRHLSPTDDAKRAVRADLDTYYDISYPTIRCQREASDRWFCRWRGQSLRDVQQGNVEGQSGTATVTRYGGRYVARVF